MAMNPNPNDPWGWVFPPEAYGPDPLAFGTGEQVPTVFPEPIPFDVPLGGPKGSNDRLGGGPPAPPPPPGPPPIRPQEPQYPGPPPAQRVGPDATNALPGEVAFTPFTAPTFPVPPEPVFPVEPAAPDFGAAFEADAISGVDGGSLPFQAPELLGPETDATKEELFDADVNRLADLDPEAFAKIQATRAATQEQFLASERLKAAQDDRKRLEDAERVRTTGLAKAQAASAKLEADTDALAHEKIDPDRWWNERGTGTKIAGYLAAALAGWLNPTGPNSVVNLISTAIDRDIEAQKADLAGRRELLGQRRGLVSDMYQRNNDIYTATEGARITYLKAFENELEARAANLDPEGTTKLRIAESIKAVRAQRAAHQAAYEKEMFERGKVEEGFKIDRERIDQQERDSKRTTGLGYSRIKFDREELGYRREKDAADRQAAIDTELAKDRREFLTDQHKQLETRGVYDATGNLMVQPEGQKLLDQAAALEAEAQANPGAAEGLLQAASQLRGTAQLEYGFKARDPDAAKKITDRMSATESLLQIVDQLRRIRGKGYDFTNAAGISRFTDSEDYQSLNSLSKQAVVAYNAANHLGTLDQGTIDIGEKIFGDPLSLLTNEPALKTARDTIERGTTNFLKNNGYRGKYKVPDSTTDPRAAKTESDKEVQAITTGKTPSQQADDAEPGLAAKASAYAFSPWDAEERIDEKGAQAFESSLSSLPGVSESQATNLRSLTKRATTGASKGRAEARGKLVSLATGDDGDLASGTIEALGEAGDLTALQQVAAQLPEDSDRLTRVSRAFDTASSVQISNLARKAKTGDADATAALRSIATNGKGRAKQLASDALAGKSIVQPVPLDKAVR